MSYMMNFMKAQVNVKLIPQWFLCTYCQNFFAINQLVKILFRLFLMKQELSVWKHYSDRLEFIHTLVSSMSLSIKQAYFITKNQRTVFYLKKALQKQVLC